MARNIFVRSTRERGRGRSGTLISVLTFHTISQFSRKSKYTGRGETRRENKTTQTEKHEALMRLTIPALVSVTLKISFFLSALVLLSSA
ncbi:hypothetical protein QQF64_034867 [Cirrhinus molitorella]|uniref:Uncharacterized protein n=1 Tax=Cirrhinus molitorella TaxID=172907 RepID=A0ABR3NEF0_9TELE